MKKLLVFLTFCVLVYPFSVNAASEAEALREALNANILVKTRCTLTVSSAAGEILLRIVGGGSGTGYFVDHTLPHLVMTAGHVVDCTPTEDVRRNMKNMFGSTALIGVNADIFVLYKTKEYLAKILKYSYNSEASGVPDFAVLLSVNMQNLDHPRLPTLTKNGIYGAGSEVIISGFRPFNRDWEPYLKKALIAKLNSEVIHLSEDIYKGMSGSPLLFYFDGKYYAIGVIVQGGFVELDGISIPADWGMATRLKDEFFEIDPKAAAQ